MARRAGATTLAAADEAALQELPAPAKGLPHQRVRRELCCLNLAAVQENYRPHSADILGVCTQAGGTHDLDSCMAV